MKKKIIIRADGGSPIGMGHVVRCLALAEMLTNDFEISFAIQQPDESVLNTIRDVTNSIMLLPAINNYTTDAFNFSQHLSDTDIVILDGYNFKTEYQQTIKSKGCKLVCIDDLHAWHHVADVLINHADGVDESDYSAEPYSKLYLGLNYILLRKPFLQTTSHRKIIAIKKVFISMGAADIDNITQKFTEALLLLKGIETIHLMLGSINPHLKSIDDLIHNNKQVNIVKHFNISAEELKVLLQECDVAICPASSIAYESCAAGIGLISGYTAPNQSGILKTLVKHHSAIDFGNMNDLNVKEITVKIEKLITQPEVFNDLIKNQKLMIDGKSPERLLEIFKRLASEKLHFRFAAETDVDLYFNWANDPAVRLNSFNQNPVAYENHVNWFQSKLKSADCFFYLFLNEKNQPAGQVRIDKSKGEIVIGISVDEKFRGKSIGIEMLTQACNDYLGQNPNSKIVAYIKVENIASYNIFKKAGFTNEQIVTEQGYKSYKLHKAL